MDKKNILAQYEQAKAQFAATGVDTDKAIDALQRVEISMHCWQGDDEMCIRDRFYPVLCARLYCRARRGIRYGAGIARLR